MFRFLILLSGFVVSDLCLASSPSGSIKKRSRTNGPLAPSLEGQISKKDAAGNLTRVLGSRFNRYFYGAHEVKRLIGLFSDVQEPREEARPQDRQTPRSLQLEVVISGVVFKKTRF